LFVSLNQPSEEWFEVYCFLGASVVDGRQQYLVQWAGYGPEHNSWHLASELRKDLGDRAFASFILSMPERPVFF